MHPIKLKPNYHLQPKRLFLFNFVTSDDFSKTTTSSDPAKVGKYVSTYVLSKNKNIEREMSFAGSKIKCSNLIELAGVTLEEDINSRKL